MRKILRYFCPVFLFYMLSGVLSAAVQDIRSQTKSANVTQIGQGLVSTGFDISALDRPALYVKLTLNVPPHTDADARWCLLDQSGNCAYTAPEIGINNDDPDVNSVSDAYVLSPCIVPSLTNVSDKYSATAWSTATVQTGSLSRHLASVPTELFSNEDDDESGLRDIWPVYAPTAYYYINVIRKSNVTVYFAPHVAAHDLPFLSLCVHGGECPSETAPNCIYTLDTFGEDEYLFSQVLEAGKYWAQFTVSRALDGLPLDIRANRTTLVPKGSSDSDSNAGGKLQSYMSTIALALAGAFLWV